MAATSGGGISSVGISLLGTKRNESWRPVPLGQSLDRRALLAVVPPILY